jgi:predicted N-acetyltransferase YhbS
MPNDMRVIRQVARWLFGEWGHLNPGATLDSAVRNLSQWAMAQTIPLLLVAYDNGAPVGTTSLVAHDMKCRRDLTPWLASVWVLPAYRNRGVGSALCRQAMREARRLRLGRVYLFTAEQMRFYKSLGWTEMREIRQVKAQTRTFVIMFSS